MRGGKFEQNLDDMEAKPTADMALRHKGLIVGIKTAHYSGPEWAPVERAVEAGTHREHSRDGGFRHQSPRAAAERAGDEEAAARRHLHARLFRAAQRAGPRPASVNPGAVRRPEARRDLRRRPRRRQLPLADRGAGGEGGFPARLDLHRPPHRQHERRHEGHAQRDGQVPGDGPVDRRRDAAIDVEPGASRSGARNWATSRSARRADIARAAPREGQLRLRRHVRRAAARHAEAGAPS